MLLLVFGYSMKPNQKLLCIITVPEITVCVLGGIMDSVHVITLSTILFLDFFKQIHIFGFQVQQVYYS